MIARRRNGRPLKQKHLQDRHIIRIMEEEDERDAKRTAGVRVNVEHDEECEDDHVYHLLRFGILSEPFLPCTTLGS